MSPDVPRSDTRPTKPTRNQLPANGILFGRSYAWMLGFQTLVTRSVGMYCQQKPHDKLHVVALYWRVAAHLGRLQGNKSC